MMHGNHMIPNTSGMSKMMDPRKSCPPPIKGGKDETAMQKVGKRSGKGGPYKNAKSVQPKPMMDGKYEATMMGKGQKR